MITALLTFVITALIFFVLYLYDCWAREKIENRQARAKNERLRSDIEDLTDVMHKRKEQDAYNNGLYDGRQTDTLYRGVLDKYSKGEQIAVMIKGDTK